MGDWEACQGRMAAIYHMAESVQLEQQTLATSRRGGSRNRTPGGCMHARAGQ